MYCSATINCSRSINKGSSFSESINLSRIISRIGGNDSNLLIVFYVQIMPDDFVMQLHRF
ncbi:hypothetical protein D4M63_14785 [Enterobacter hormaechei]|nr:hypothetical protein AM444_14925 [Enterobacter cloacae complex sp.]TXV93070.1 hypothetical protein D4M63_14785 [Enterobacter hormaechei]